MYVYYTATTPAVHNRVSRFTANGNVAVAGSEVILLDLNNLSSATNHNGGAMHFGLDGKLYIAVGDNANGVEFADARQPARQDAAHQHRRQRSRTDNPFFSQTTGNNRAIWALGLRNPFTFAFQPHAAGCSSTTSAQNTWEEINEGVAGANYGWPTTEGADTDPAYHARPSVPIRTRHGPVMAARSPAARFTTRRPRSSRPSTSATISSPTSAAAGSSSSTDRRHRAVSHVRVRHPSPVDLEVGPDGSLYYLARGTGTGRRRPAINFTGGQAPAITQHPANRTVSVGQSASFTVAASGAPPLSYQWQRNGVNISGATAASYTLPSAMPATTARSSAAW